MAKNDDLDKSIDRSLDDFGGFLRRKWWLVILLLLLGWYTVVNIVPQISAPSPGSILGFVLQASMLVFFILIQFIALFWFLGRPRIYWVMPGETGVGFEDYKGNPEVLEAARRIVILMRGVKGFKEMGGEISRGLLLVGPPGTGKSYLAQCISTEAGVPFAYASAASFRAMFIGMDVLMIKNLYRKARRLAREYGGCILFMDEFDAIGQARGGQGNMAMGGGMMGMMGGGTGGLNELLMQMDPPPMDNAWWKKLMRAVGLYHGRVQREPVLTIGATNIPDSLDAALLRPGRFDRKIIVAPPTDRYRGEVIQFYLDKVTHEPMVMQKLVSDMMGYTPVAIKHVINEAVVLAHFSGRHTITYHDISEARETHEYGIRYPRTLSLLEKRRLAYHEAGHAVAQVKLLPRHRVTHATITKRLGSSGEAFVAYKPTEEIVTQSADEVFAEIETLLASRASEELFLQTRLNGVGGDLQQATRLALYYVTHWGMGDEFFSAAAIATPDSIYSDASTRKEAEALMRKAYTEVRDLLSHNQAAVRAVAEALLRREDLDSDEILALIAHAEAPALASIAVAALSDVPPLLSAPVPVPVPASDSVPNGAHDGVPYPAAAGAAATATASVSPNGHVADAESAAADGQSIGPVAAEHAEQHNADAGS